MIASTYISSSDSEFNYRVENEKIALNISICTIFDRSYGSPTKQEKHHSHSIFEGHFILNGESDFELSDGTIYTVRKNQFIIIPTDCKHRINCESVEFSKLILSFDMDVKDSSDADYYNSFKKELENVKVYEISNEMFFAIKMLHENSEQKKHGWDKLIDSYTLAFLIETAAVVIKDKNILNKPHHDKRVLKAKEFIKEKVSYPITVNDVADYVSVSKRQLARLFLKYENTSPSDCIRNSKLNLATTLLRDTDLPISEIAERTGFSSASSFINFFNKMESTTPAKYRKISQKLIKKHILGGQNEKLKY